MAFQVRVRVNKNEIKVLSVASSSEEFEKFTIKELKEKALSFFPSVDGRFTFVSILTIETNQVNNIYNVFSVIFRVLLLSDPDRLRVIFGERELEDSQTLDSCDIEHLSVLIIVLQVPGGARATVCLFIPI